MDLEARLAVRSKAGVLSVWLDSAQFVGLLPADMDSLDKERLALFLAEKEVLSCDT